MLVFDNSTVQTRFTVESLQIRSGGAADRLVVFASPAVPGWKFYSADRTILRHPGLQEIPSVKEQIQGIGRRRLTARALTTGILALIVLLLAGTVLLKKPLVRLITNRLPASVESKIGETAYGLVSRDRNVLNSPAVRVQCDELVAGLVEATEDTPYDFQFHVLEDSAVNAFALPGGTVVLNTGLILKAERPEEILGVLAHEIAHVTERHSMRNLVESVGLALLVQTFLGDVSGLAAVLIDNSSFLMRMQFSREYEREADEEGLQFLVSANIDPSGMVDFFSKLKEEEDQAAGGLSGALELISTHPATDERIGALRNSIDTLPPAEYGSSSFDLQAFKRAIAQELEQVQVEE